jgi:hypothetical protein
MDFLSGIRDYQRQFIREIHFIIGSFSDKRHEKKAMKLLRQCTSLRRLDAVVLQSYMGEPSSLESAGIKELKKLRGCKEINLSLRRLSVEGRFGIHPNFSPQV